MVKVRAVGSVKVRDICGSGSLRGGWVTRMRVIRTVSGWLADEAPAAANRSVGRRRVDVAGPTPGIEMEAKPTGLNPS
jgi:hypothetical protein